MKIQTEEKRISGKESTQGTYLGVNAKNSGSQSVPRNVALNMFPVDW